MSLPLASPVDPILPPEALRKLLDTHKDVVLLDARGSRANYDAGHLAGAVHVDLNEHLSSALDPGADPARGGRHPLPDIHRWSRTLGELGISPASLVVVYDDQAGANAAARAWWMLRSAGHERVTVLDGGLDAARSAGLPMTTAAPAVRVEPPYPARGWLWPTVDITAVDQRRKDRSWMVLDVRSYPRYAGETEPIDPLAGHIPGAVNVPFADNLRSGRFETRQALRDLYLEALGGVSPDHLIVHCGSGVTACHTLLALELAGLTGASLYVGSWSEWCRSGRPRDPDPRTAPPFRSTPDRIGSGAHGGVMTEETRTERQYGLVDFETTSPRRDRFLVRISHRPVSGSPAIVGTTEVDARQLERLLTHLGVNARRAPQAAGNDPIDSLIPDVAPREAIAYAVERLVQPPASPGTSLQEDPVVLILDVTEQNVRERVADWRS